MGVRREVNADDVRAAAASIAGVAHRTPVMRSRTLDELAGHPVYLKCENFQRGGAFKFRGAYNAACQLDPQERARGLVAFSSGNHAQAVALSASLLGTTAVIVMPQDAPRSKLDAVRGYGAEVVTYDRLAEDREVIAAGLAAERGLALIPPYDYRNVIAGQGTAALELLEEVGTLDALVVPIGGGGLAAGTAIIATDIAPGIEVTGVEPESGDDTKRSLEAGRRVAVAPPRTIADGLMHESPGELTFAINKRLLAGVVTVTDGELVDAMRFAFERLKLVIEPSAAGALAALLTGKLGASGRTGVVLSGGNVGADRFTELLRPGG